MCSDWSTTSLFIMTVMVGAYEAKVRFSEYLDRVSRGEVITVSRHGVPVAQLGPISGPSEQQARQAVQEIRQLRSGARLGGLSLADLRDEGRP